MKLSTVIHFIKEFLICLVPMFVTDHVAIVETEDGLMPLGNMRIFDESAYPDLDGYITINAFTWLGYAIPVQTQVDQIKPTSMYASEVSK